MRVRSLGTLPHTGFLATWVVCLSPQGRDEAGGQRGWGWKASPGGHDPPFQRGMWGGGARAPHDWESAARDFQPQRGDWPPGSGAWGIWGGGCPLMALGAQGRGSGCPGRSSSGQASPAPQPPQPLGPGRKPPLPPTRKSIWPLFGISSLAVAVVPEPAPGLPSCPGAGPGSPRGPGGSLWSLRNSASQPTNPLR